MNSFVSTRNMKNTLWVGILIMTLLLSMGVTEKYYRGPCLVVPELDPCPDPDYIKVYLFTRKNPTTGQYVEIFETKDNLANSYFVPKNPNKIILHGFTASMDLDVLQDIKAEYLKHSDVNVWMVNYPELVANILCYWFAVDNIKHVGKCLALFIEALRRHRSNNIHAIGFSLGAQVTNYLANSLRGNKLDRITGLDPAGPFFTLKDKKYRLDPSDAKFVDVIHTDGAKQGDFEWCGDIDFFVNGGISQPGCYKSILHIVSYSDCNHRRAPQYFAESINSKVGFIGWQCDSQIDYIKGRCKPNPNIALMGEHCPIGISGLYIVETAAEKPFALGKRERNYYRTKLLANPIFYY